MKKVLYILLPAILLVSSCAEDYLDTTPTDAVSETQVFTNTQNAMAALNGIHRAMFIRYDSQGQPGHGGVMIMSEVMGDDVVMTTQGNGWFVSISRWLTHILDTAGDVEFVWKFYYKIIGNANMLIANIDEAEGPQEDKDIIKGQALAYRAWAHFQLVQFFAERYEAGAANSQLGVPIVTEPITEGGPRNTVEEVYAQVHQDLDAAMALLTESREAKSHFNINVVKGIKARVALTQGNWAAAAQLASEARQGINLMNEEQLFDGFNNVSNPEWMWGSRQVTDEQTYFASFFAYMSYNYNSTNIRQNPKAINSDLYEKMSETDARRGLWDPTGEDIDVPSTYSRMPYMNRKFASIGADASVGDVPYMRASEMYLIEAEALARDGNDAAAAEVLRDFAVTRDPEYTLSANTGAALIEEIMTQRRIELWGEGFRFLDLKRLNQPLDRTGANHVASVINDKFHVPAGDKTWQWLIPRDELNANEHMVQNPL